MKTAELLRFARFAARLAWPKILDVLLTIGFIALGIGFIALCIKYPAAALGMCALVFVAFLGMYIEEAYVQWKHRGKP